MSGRTILCSDLHDGHPVAHTGQLIAMLTRERWDRLVLAGDVWDSDHCISANGWRLLELLGKWKVMREIVLLPGNHDPSNARAARAAGLGWGADYTWVEGGLRFHSRHGHVGPGPDYRPWDRYLRVYRGPTRLGNQLESDLCCYGGFLGRKLAVAGHRLRRRLFDCRATVRAGALDLAAVRDYDWIFCGHTHYAEVLPLTVHTPGYANLGSWCQGDTCTYAVVENGEVRLEEFRPC